MKKTLISLCLALLPLLSFAQGTFYVNPKTGNAGVFSMEGTKLFFLDGTLSVMEPQKEGVVYQLSALRSITFRSTNGIQTVQGNTSAAPTLLVAYGGNTIEVRGLEGPADIAVYSLAGKQMFAVKDWKGGAISIASLPKGTYLIKVGDKYGTKFIKR